MVVTSATRLAEEGKAPSYRRGAAARSRRRPGPPFHRWQELRHRGAPPFVQGDRQQAWVDPQSADSAERGRLGNGELTLNPNPQPTPHCPISNCLPTPGTEFEASQWRRHQGTLHPAAHRGSLQGGDVPADTRASWDGGEAAFQPSEPEAPAQQSWSCPRC